MPYEENVTFSLPLFHGRYQDLLILLLNKALCMRLLIDSNLQTSLLSILFNLSPFVKQINVQSVSALMQLIAVYTNPSWLLHDSDSFLPIKMILDSILNMLAYNYEENPLLAFALLNQSKKITRFAESKLRDLTELKGKLEEVKFANQDTDEEKEGEEKKEQPWTPTEQWYEESKKTLPLKPIIAILSHVSNRLEKAYIVYESTEAEILNLLKRISLIGVQEDVLKFAFMHFTIVPEIEAWLSGYLWKTILVRNFAAGIFVIDRVRYVVVKSSWTMAKETAKANETAELKEDQIVSLQVRAGEVEKV